jgi:hypothetical protein
MSREAASPQIDDAELVRRVLARYLLANDRGDASMLRSCFAADAAMYVAGKLVAGPDTDADIVSTVLPGSAPGETPVQMEIPAAEGLRMTDIRGRTHVMGQCYATVDGDRARSETYVTSYLVVPSGSSETMLVRGLRYGNAYRRTPDGWLITVHRITFDWVFEAPVQMALSAAEREDFGLYP